ncbi:hypothetical protein HDU93_003351 [Gonapodya sp. JEL0774]|nr:hypothetical protein HDU93_003351 [Gonapodya sp. JEL0774]
MSNVSRGPVWKARASRRRLLAMLAITLGVYFACLWLGSEGEKRAHNLSSRSVQSEPMNDDRPEGQSPLVADELHFSIPQIHIQPLGQHVDIKPDPPVRSVPETRPVYRDPVTDRWPICPSQLSLVTACQNRHDHLRTALASWIRTTSPLKQIVIVDWSSEPGLESVVKEVLEAWEDDVYQDQDKMKSNSDEAQMKQCWERPKLILLQSSGVESDILAGESSLALPWILSWANNLAAYAATMPELSRDEFSRGIVISTTDAHKYEGGDHTILKLDCDVIVHPDIIDTLSAAGCPCGRAHADGRVLPPNSFLSGNWRTASTENDFHLNGDFAVRVADFHAIRGYDERIQTYGWDDSDLYERLMRLGATGGNGTRKVDIPAGSLTHIAHSDSDRVSGRGGRRNLTNLAFEILRNRLLSEAAPAWPGNVTGSRFRLRMVNPEKAYCGENGRCYVLQTIGAQLLSHPPPLKEFVSEATQQSIELTAYRTTLRKYGLLVPLSFMQLPTSYLSALLGTFTIATQGITALDARPSSVPKVAGILTIDVQHGLSNRLRALASAASVAKQAGWHLRVVWVPDAHCGARFDELFEVGDLDVWSEPIDPLEWKAVKPFTKHYSYMDSDGGKREPIDTITGTDPAIRPATSKQTYRVQQVYVKSAYLLNHTAGMNSKEIGKFLRSLTPRPSIRKKIALMKNNFRGESYVGVHIRATPPLGEFVGLRPEDYSEKGWKSLETARRATSDVNKFVSRLSDSKSGVYLSSDSPIAVQKLLDRLGPRVRWLDSQGCINRSARCLEYAIADLWVLGGAEKLVGSWWSSFGEVAGYLGGIDVDYVGRTAD